MSVRQIRPTKPTQSIVYFSPEMARRVLSKNTRNRPLSEMHVSRLMAEMESGRWQYNGDTIRWSVDDELLDGQHRMTALSRMPDDFPPLPFLVVRGLSTESQATMDQGRTRSAGDQLNIDGLTANHGKNLAAAIRVYIDWQSGNFFKDRAHNSVSNTGVVQWAKEHPVELQILETLVGDRIRRVKCKPSVTTAVLLHLHLIDGESARQFTEALISGAELTTDNPIYALRERLERIKAQRLNLPDRDMVAFFVLAWNAWRNHRKMTKFQRPAGGSWTRDSFPEAV